VFIPVKQMLACFSSRPYFSIQVKAGSLEKLEETKEELRGVLRKIRRVPPGEEDDFSINQQETFINTFNRVAGTIAAVGLFITGLSLLLLFVALNVERGFWTVTIAHTTLTVCFVAVVVQSRLGALDRGLEEAAMDLGCDPLRAFVAVTLPLIVPAIAAGWMLAFTLSLDDLVIASFTTGPGSATLPIRIYSEVRLGVKPEINAICTLVIGLIAAVIAGASLASKLTAARGESAAPL